MKKTILFLFIKVVSCNPKQVNDYNNLLDDKQSWINSYKYEVFWGCMNEGLENDSLRIVLEKKDLFNPYSDMDFINIDNARKLGANKVKNLPVAYIKIDKGEEHLKGKNFISSACLTYYASNHLDSVANVEYKKYLKTNKE